MRINPTFYSYNAVDGTVSEDTIEKLINGIAVAKGVEPESLDVALQNQVSTDAIRKLANHESDSWRLQFETPQHVVEVTGNDTVLVDGKKV